MLPAASRNGASKILPRRLLLPIVARQHSAMTKR
jgi:hypothetical protein